LRKISRKKKNTGDQNRQIGISLGILADDDFVVCRGISITKPTSGRLRAMNPAEEPDASTWGAYRSTA
jgi:hypothetical protein